MQRLPNTYGAAMPQMAEQARQRSAGDWSGEISRMPMEPIRQTPAGQGGMSGPMGAAGPVGMAGSRTVPPELADMSNDLPVEVITAPTSTREAYMGSWKALLSRYEGSYVVATFLVGTQNTISWEGILFDVGNDYLTIYQESRDRYIVSDYYSLKFIEFYDIQRRRRCAELLREDGWQSNGMSDSMGANVSGGMGGGMAGGSMGSGMPRR